MFPTYETIMTSHKTRHTRTPARVTVIATCCFQISFHYSWCSRSFPLGHINPSHPAVNVTPFLFYIQCDWAQISQDCQKRCSPLTHCNNISWKNTCNQTVFLFCTYGICSASLQPGGSLGQWEMLKKDGGWFTGAKTTFVWIFLFYPGE